MNRAEKRNQEKIYKKKMQWAESLRPWQKEFINDALADARATIETEVVSKTINKLGKDVAEEIAEILKAFCLIR